MANLQRKVGGENENYGKKLVLAWRNKIVFEKWRLNKCSLATYYTKLISMQYKKI